MAQTIDLSYNTMQVQGWLGWIFYIVVIAAAIIILLFLFYKMWQNATYKESVDVYKKVGDTTIQFEDSSKVVQLDGDYMQHYKGMKKYSPIIKDKYKRIKKTKLFGLLPSSKISFSVYKVGESLFPIEVKNNPGLIPINLDLFNYMQSRIKQNQKKYERQDRLIQMMPYLALGAVVIFFIVGLIFYGQHIERVAQLVITTAKDQADQIISQAGGQIIQ